MTLEKLINNSIAVCDGMPICYPEPQREELLHVSDATSTFDYCFSINNHVIAFICEQHMYVVPYTDDAMCVLKAEEFFEEIFYVPFSNQDYPKNAKEKWDKLCTEAQKRPRPFLVADYDHASRLCPTDFHIPQTHLPRAWGSSLSKKAILSLTNQR